MDRQDLIAIETSYQAKYGKSGVSCSIDPRAQELNGAPLYSIRGDLRDYYLARKVFSESALHMTGWLPFLARKIPLFDLPFRFGLLRATNRYRMWMELLGLECRELEELYRGARAARTGNGRAAIHLGAQWRSKQFPAVRELASLLERGGKPVDILAGEGDPLPRGLSGSQVQVVMGRDLVARLRRYDFAVTNDSGPMHLAALLGVPTVALGLTSNLECWAPPGVLQVKGEAMPRGYAPARGYWSEKGAKGWPTPEKVLEEIRHAQLI